MLATHEQNKLNELEEVIERNLQGSYEVGNALVRVRDGRLYKAARKTFEAYCRAKRELTKTSANRLIGSAKVLEVLTPKGAIPASERVAPSSAWNQSNKGKYDTKP
jgi:hypothetical protein